jgi:serine-type D-Ala-D-Ala endopeptidase (penicillin-binding protein 7)
MSMANLHSSFGLKWLRGLALAATACFGLAALGLAVPAWAKQQTQASAKGKPVAKRGGHANKSVIRTHAKGRNIKQKGRKNRVVAMVPPKPSFGQLAGLHTAQDELALKSAVALVIDQDTQEVLFSKNDKAVLPIASLTKLMTGVVISDAKLDLNEQITITEADVDTEKGSRSRLKVGTTLSRGELMHLAMMSSENRAAHALGRTYPGGLSAFVAVMNAKARQLGMNDSTFVEPTGLSSKNQSSARDLAQLVSAASQVPTLREYSTSQGAQVPVGARVVNYVNTNRLTANPNWDIALQKTGYISEAGQCLVMQAKVAGRKLTMVFLDSFGKYSRLGDAERVRAWVEANPKSVPRS